MRRARLIGAAFVYAPSHDRFFNDGRFRSAYAAGDISLPPGWTPNNRAVTVPIPGFAREGRGFVEVGQGSVDTGNNACARAYPRSVTLKQFFGRRPLRDITPMMLRRLKGELLAGKTRRLDSEGEQTTRKGSTVNRYLQLLSKIFEL